MRAIRSKDTRPEIMLRKALHALGFRFRLHVKNLPGSPDIVLPKYHAAIFVHGCFWHGHACPLFRLPKTRASFWQEKILANVKRDEDAIKQLEGSGWRVATVWECAMKGKGKILEEALLGELMRWLKSGTLVRIEIGCRQPDTA